MSFQTEIITWYLQNKRDLPWRNTRDPYVIWLSEIILQQTRVEQGLPYFTKFLEAFPTVAAFAAASETQILKLWQGLGYYSRGRNMLFTAQQISADHQNVFPTGYDQLIQLKGVGDYTAAAISSFSADELKPVLDGNVFRVLSRYFGISTPINSNNGKKEFIMLARELIIGQKPSLYNQAIMEFGALQCKPRSPNCTVCPLQSGCYARTNHLVDSLPVKEKKLKKRIRYFNYLLCVKDQQILVHQRTGSDIWQELFDLPLLETENNFQDDFKNFSDQLNKSYGEAVNITHLEQKKHLLTHQTIYVDFFALDNYIINFSQNADIKWVTLAEFEQLPQPKVIANFIEKHFSNQI
ncbi:MAG: A/G-specific adenine glycosylase [Pedobacter sp.]|nr:A/G-specific adenine glycosylase [Pedobacter sp.]